MFARTKVLSLTVVTLLAFTTLIPCASAPINLLPVSDQPQSPRFVSPPAASSQNEAATQARLEQTFGQLPLYFVENQGQMDERVAYYIQGSDKTIYFTPDGVTFALTAPLTQTATNPAAHTASLRPAAFQPERETPPERQRWVVKLDFVGANPNVRPVGEERTEAVISYFKGPQEQWHTGLPTYSRIVYRDLWPGIDLVYYGTVNALKYEFVVHPGADSAQIRLAYRGADVALNAAGQLEVTTPAGGFADDTPVAYQEIDRRRVDVAVAYNLTPPHNPLSSPNGEGTGGEVRLDLASYDPTRLLVIDPVVLVYCGYIGGSDDDRGYGIAVDGAGNAYVTGSTGSTEASFPVTVGPDLTYNGGYDAFVAKVNAGGTALVYAGYIGGSGSDSGQGIAVDGAGNAYVAGDTNSTEATFPVTVGPDMTYNGSDDAFVAKVNPSGTALVYAGYIGGSSTESGKGIAVDGAGNAYVTGDTWSTEATFPVVVGPDLTYNGSDDAFVAKVNPSGTALVYCGYIGGSGSDYVSGIAVDAVGNAYVTGTTGSTEATFPVAAGPDLTYDGGDYDAFVAKVTTGRPIDLTISLYRSVSASERIPYEQILGYFADAIYEMSNGMHTVRNVTIYQGGAYSNTANVLWNASEWPRAHVAGYGQSGLRVWMGDVFPFKDKNSNPVPYNALAEGNRRGAGYALAHEWGHYYYGLYDEYAAGCGNYCGEIWFPRPDDIPVPNSVMNSQWNAVSGNFNWLNFSITKNITTTGKTAQHRVYAASGWETVVRPTSEDPRDGERAARPVRPYYPELTAVAPGVGQDASLELPTTPTTTTRSELDIVWVDAGATASRAQGGFAYWATVRSVLGSEISYPQPVVLAASVAKSDLIARAGITVTAEAPNGSVSSLSLADDGAPPDVLADDGLYSGLMPYDRGGTYSITVTFDNDMGTAMFTQASAAHSIGPNGETYSPTVQSVGENFAVVATTTVVINDFQADDHGDTPQSATVLLPDNVDVPGRIDRAGDIDVFEVTPSQTETLALRVTNLALGMQPKIRVLGADGVTVIHEFAFQPTAGEYFFTLLDVTAGAPFYVEISHLDSNAAGGLYDVSAGRPLANDRESPVYFIYLPLILRNR